MKFKLLAMLISVILLAVTGCTQQEVKPTPTATLTAMPTPIATITQTPTPTATPTPTRIPEWRNITIKDYAFIPREATIHAGDIVKWYSDQNMVTIIIADDGSWNSTPIERGQSFTKEFPTAGVFNYTMKGMSAVKGSITVLP